MERLTLFMQNIDKRDYDGCWKWKSHQDDDGYGIFRMRNRMRKVHEIIWELFTGKPIPDDFVIFQSCENKLCASPRHLGWKKK